MRKKNIAIVALLLLVLITGVVIVGCDVSNNISEGENREEGINVEDGDNEEEISINVGNKDHDILIRSENISDLVVDLYGIDNASSIIFNDMVAIAVEMASDSTFTDDVKEMIINTVLENDTMIRQVLLTDSDRIFEQIEAIIHSLMNGEPYDNHVKEVNRIIEKLKKE